MSSATPPGKIGRFLPMLLAPTLLAALLLIGWTSTPAFAQDDTGITRTQWQIARSEKVVPVGNVKIKTSEVFTYTQVPTETAAVWQEAPLRDGDIYFAGGSRVRCNQELDFTYFQTFVTIPPNYTINKAEVSIDKVDDYARVLVYNKSHAGEHAGQDLLPPIQQQLARIDLKNLVASGERNRIVIVQIDHCGSGNNLINAQLHIEGTDANGKPIDALVPVGSTGLYVDKDATGQATGLSWTDAFTNVQDALAVVKSGQQIWVAEGVYYPDTGKGQKDNDRKASFAVPAGVALYGGFAGIETLLNERNWRQNVTVLSGDIGQDDSVDANGVVTGTNQIVGNNSLHVVSLNGKTNAISDTTRIDGFVVTAGQANGAQPPENMGGGLFCDGSAKGTCSPTLINMTFSGNRAKENGGAIYNFGQGGASSPTLTNVIFSGNSAQYGGALYNYGGVSGNSSPTLINVTFSGNAAGNWGGALLNQGENGGNSSPTLTNVTFSGNRARTQGGAIYNYGSRNGNSIPILTNVILWKNSAPQGPSIYNLDKAGVSIKNSLVDGGKGSIAGTSANFVTYDAANLTSDPLFVEPVDPAAAPTSAGNLRLMAGSPAINAGDSSVLPADVTTDLAGNQRIAGGSVDMGAYEFYATAALAQVVDAKTDMPIAEAGVCMDALTPCATTDSSGNYTFADVSAGEHTLTVTASSYITGGNSFTIAAGETITQKIALAPVATDAKSMDDLTIVLAWGQTPKDLDSHLWLPASNPYHIYYQEGNHGSPDTFPYAHLDVDDTESEGPETITILEPQSGVYSYAVHNYSQDGSITDSGAYVRVYRGSEMLKEYRPPAGEGLWWHVFDIDGDSGKLIDVNQLQAAEPATN